ncbi:tripartite motif-containing protein 45-like [Dendronephthya gigantea]|uniref:tripartite motif-containing protein 45-like n=1 Tax=Dendronephthya gigantea TaxID=151771 RepID=UPI00106BD568|nr:tripartite motif-containing protein 45-like [Dendronephthya gigantea]
MADSLTSSRSIVEIHNLLVCDICKKTISEPKTLSCSHSFCKTCVENLAIQEEDVESEDKTDKLKCPTCKSITTIKTGGTVAELPDNEFVVKLLTVVDPNREHSEQEASLCSVCHKESVLTLCMECEMLLCHSCNASHNIWPRNRSHALISVSEIANRDEKKQIVADTLRCTATGHETAIPEFYCETCKELICIKCVASVHTKPGHTCIAIHQMYLKQQDAVKSKYATISEMLKEGNEALERFRNSKTTYEKAAKDIKLKHTVQKDEIMKAFASRIDKILEEKIREVDNVYDSSCQKLSAQIELMSNYLEKVEKSLPGTNDALENSKLEELLATQKVIDDNIQMLQYLSSFQIQLVDEQSCMTKPHFYKAIKQLADTCTDAMPDTSILKYNEKLFDQLLRFFERTVPLRLCYRASLHGWESQTFHRLCDSKKPTVVLVQVGKWIFGGYTDQSWKVTFTKQVLLDFSFP